MDESFLNKAIINIQDEYLNLLIKIKDNVNIEDYLYIVDEINVFWYTYMKTINLYLSTIFVNDNAYVLTGATYLDVDKFEHYPFAMIGNIHIIDDPIYKYANRLYNCKNSNIIKILNDQILQSIDDNIKILEKYPEIFLILPLSLFNKNDIDTQVDEIFLNMFSENILDIDTYFNKFNTIDEIVSGLKLNLKTRIIFDENDDKTISLEKRFENYINKDDFEFLNLKYDSEKFYFLVSYFVNQSLNIIFNCLNFNLVPHLRYKVVFNYVMLIGEIYLNIPEIKNMLFKCQIAYVIYQIFDKYKFKEIPFRDFYKKINQYNFTEKIESELIEKSITIENAHIQEVIDILNHHIEKCLI